MSNLIITKGITKKRSDDPDAEGDNFYKMK